MKTTVYCRPTAKGVHSFYLLVESREIFLFSQPYRKGVGDFFGKGLVLDEAMKFGKARDDKAIIRTMSKIPMFIKYVEKEYGMEVLEKTKKNKKLNKIA